MAAERRARGRALRAFGLVVALSLVATGVSGCAYACSGCHPPFVVCGTTLEGGGGGGFFFYVLRGRETEISYMDAYDPLYIIVARGCAHGSNVTWSPRSAARLLKAAYARDGLAAAVVLQPVRQGVAFHLIATQHGKVAGTATVKPMQ